MFEKQGLSLGRFGGKRGAAMDGTSTLGISPEKVCYIIVKARQFEAKDVVTDPDSGSNPVDDGMVSVLEDGANAAAAATRNSVLLTALKW